MIFKCKTPMQTFKDSKHIAQEKDLSRMLEISDSAINLAEAT